MGLVLAYGENGKTSQPLLAKLRYLFIFAMVFAGSFLILSISNGTDIIYIENEVTSKNHKSDHYNDDFQNFVQSYTIKTEGCVIPAMKPLDNSVKKFVKYPGKMESCPNADHPLLDKNKTHIWIVKENIKHYNVSTTVTCCYKSFYRPNKVDNIMSSRIDDRVKYNDCFYFSDEIEVTDEFIRVICSTNGIKIYEQYFVFTPKKMYVSHDDSTEIPRSNSTYNVIIMGIDAVSRLNLYRTMPKTINYLKDKGAVELLGYNKVGDNTFPNSMPMLLGIKDTEMKTVCLPTGQSTFDNCPFIWEWFKQAGFYTAIGEDSGWLGLFNYVKWGFSRTPTDYYFHTFINEAEKNVGRVKDFNSNLCLSDKYTFQIFLDYIESLSLTLQLNRFFGFFWEITMSHDYLNYPMVMDDSYQRFFEKLYESEYLNETIFFFMSDHGIRWGDIRSTKQGRLEERLPFVFVLTPTSFQETYSEAYNNLKLNRRRLTTPFDIHATLTDLLNMETIINKEIAIRSNEYYASNRGISLFLPITQNRTCQMAGIDDHWCTCHRGFKLSSQNPDAMKAAAQLVKFLNKLVKEYPQCSKLILAEIIEVSEMIAKVKSDEKLSWREFMVVVRTEPGGGIFEATLRHDDIQGWVLSGTISRLNLYGSQSRCMYNYQLKLYCYCA